MKDSRVVTFVNNLYPNNELLFIQRKILFLCLQFGKKPKPDDTIHLLPELCYITGT